MIIIAECFQQIMKNNASSSDDDGDVDVKVEVEAVDTRQRDKVEEPLWSVGDLQPDEEVWLLNVPSHVSLNLYPGKPCCGALGKFLLNFCWPRKWPQFLGLSRGGGVPFSYDWLMVELILAASKGIMQPA